MRGVVSQADIVSALRHEYDQPETHAPEIMALVCQLERAMGTAQPLGPLLLLSEYHAPPHSLRLVGLALHSLHSAEQRRGRRHGLSIPLLVARGHRRRAGSALAHRALCGQ